MPLTVGMASYTILPPTMVSSGLMILDLVGRHREIVAVEHQKIGVFAGRQRAEIAFLEQEQRVRAGVRDQRLLARDASAG